MAEAVQSGIVRDAQPEEGPAANVTRWQAEVVEAKAHWKSAFDRMRRNMEFANGKQWPGQKDQETRFIANLVQRIVKTTVASLYTKNPTVTVGRRKKLDFVMWDGKPESAMQALQVVQQAQMAMAGAMTGQVPVDPMTGAPIPPPAPEMVQQAQMLIEDITQGVQRREMMDKLGKTLVCLTDYYIDEAKPGFKKQMKQMIRRARTTGVGYVELGFQRAMELSEDQTRSITDMAERLAVIGQLQADVDDGEIDPNSAQAEELQKAIAAIQAEPEVIVREGVVFDFPHSTRLIPSMSTEKLMGWVGCEWIAKEILLTPERVKQIYGIDVGSNYTAYQATKNTPLTGAVKKAAKGSKGLVCVWKIHDKDTGLVFVVAEGYPGYLREPASPKVFIEQFFPYFAVTFNDVESEGDLFPKSDVELLTPVQMEYNRSKEALRQHRIAARPLYVAPDGVFEEEEEQSLANYSAHSVIKLRALDKGMKSADILMPVQKVNIDPNVYEVNTLFEDMSRITGNQEAVLGGISGGSATENNIAEGARQGSVGLDSDDLDEMLSDLFRATGQVMLTELNEETVKEIVGPGAVWPQLTRLEVMKEMYLQVKAGSSGRPDSARKAATFERIYPVLLQVPGVSPAWLAETAIRLIDDDIDLEDAVIEGLPSIMSQNKQQEIGTGDPATDPNAQGSEGGDKNRAPAPGGKDSSSFPGQ